MSEDPVVALVLVPAAEAEPAARALRAEGFLVGPHVGISMAITAPRRNFERVFGTRVEDSAEGGWVAEGGNAGAAARAAPAGPRGARRDGDLR